MRQMNSWGVATMYHVRAADSQRQRQRQRCTYPIEEWAAGRSWQKPRPSVIVDSVSWPGLVSARGRAKLIDLSPIKCFHAAVAKREEGSAVKVVPPRLVGSAQRFKPKRNSHPDISRCPRGGGSAHRRLIVPKREGVHVSHRLRSGRQ